jgi:dihydrodipicolinate synthase/N-acetylneuraminate lyase
MLSSFPTDAISKSVWAVPPLARHEGFALNRQANRAIVRHLEEGGISALLYGGNAVFYHVRLSEYHEIAELITEAAGETTLVIPSVGPAYGLMMDQSRILADLEFPAAMILPQKEIATSDGIAAGVRQFVDAFGKPIVLYIKHDGAVEPATAGRLMDEGRIAAVKYAVVRDDPGHDHYLRALIDAVGADRMLSGMGEQPAIVHMRDFGLAGFTTGCGCIAPRLSMNLLHAIQSKNYTQAERICAEFAPLEELRNRYGPITILHAAVTLAGIADTGPVLPLLSAADSRFHEEIRTRANELLAANQDLSRSR